jgi:monothiol glutaredoxin
VTMPRRVLEEGKIHSAIRDKVATYRSAVVEEVEQAVKTHDVVVVGMRQNPFPKRARRLLERNGVAHHYLEYGSYLSQWQQRLPLKLWSGWPTFPMIFVRGVLIGGFQDLERLFAAAEFSALLSAPRA